MSDESDFLEAIADAPDDDTVRLAYADWLAEHGKLTQAKLLRHPGQDNPLGLRGTQEWLGPIVRRNQELVFRRGIPSIASYTYQHDRMLPIAEEEILALAAS